MPTESSRPENKAKGAASGDALATSTEYSFLHRVRAPPPIRIDDALQRRAPPPTTSHQAASQAEKEEHARWTTQPRVFVGDPRFSVARSMYRRDTIRYETPMNAEYDDTTNGSRGGDYDEVSGRGDGDEDAAKGGAERCCV